MERAANMSVENAGKLPDPEHPRPENDLLLVADLVTITGVIVWVLGQCFVMLLLMTLGLFALGAGLESVVLIHLLVTAAGVALVLVLRMMLKRRIAPMVVVLCLILLAALPWLARGQLVWLFFWFG